MKSVHPSSCARILFVVVLVALSWSDGLQSRAVAAECAVPASGLVSWWRCEGNGNDFTGGNSGTVVGATTVTGQVGEALNFDGSGQKVMIPDNDALKLTNSLTIEGWIFPRANGFILFRGDSRPGLDPYALTIELTHELQFLVCNAANEAMFLRTPSAVPMNQWMHVASTLDGVTGDARLYVNGVLASQTNTTIRPLRDLDPNYGAGLGIGGHAGNYNYFSFDGMIDELSVYNRALTSNEVASIYAADGAGKCTSPVVSDCVTPPADLVSWWQGEGSGADVTGGNSGTLSPSGASYATGLVGQGFRFDGTNGYLQIPDAPSLKPANVTAEAWVWLDPALPPNRGGEQIVFKKNTWSAWFEGYSLLKVTIDNGNGTYSDRFQFCVSRTGNQVAINSTTIAQRGVWHHVAATYDGNKSTLYVNGVAEATATPGFALDYGTDPVYIGTSGTWAPYLSMFGGIIDEPSLYSRALTANEIAAIYHAGSAGKCSAVSPQTGPAVITDFAPKSGTNGIIVILTGTNFSPVGVSNIVYFGAVRVPVLAASATSLTVSVPIGATFAPPTVTVAGLTAYARAPFMPTFNGGNLTISSSSFAPRVDISNPIGAHRTVIADFDGDGKPDLAVSGGVQHGISLYRNIGSPGSLTEASFAPRVDILTVAAADSPWDLVVADVDGDGKLDLLEANRGSNIVSILRNISTTGSLTANSFAPSVDLVVGDLPLGIVVRDMDGDGRADVVVGNFNSGNIAVFRNIGVPGSLSTNSFAAPVFFPAEAGSHSVAAEDLDGDGRPDLVVANANANSISILRNTSTPGVIDAASFAPQFSLPTPEYTHCVKIADLDGDGKPDVLVASVFGYALSVFRNLASPGVLDSISFAARVDFPLGGRGHTISLGDLNGDNKLDVVVDTEINSFVSVFQNQSTPGSFTTASLAARVDLSTGYNAWGASVGDLDGDGRPDIVFANAYDNTISIYRNLVVGAAPKIVQEPPKETTVTAGSPVAFTVVATGSAPLAYQWFFKQAAISGATNATYSISSATSTNAGAYQVRVTNPFGIVFSQGNLLNVLPAPLVPVITDFTPKSGVPGSTVVSFIGSNFSAFATSNIVYFGAERAAVSFASATTLRVIVPKSATYAPPTVTVRGLTGAAKNSFTPTFAGSGLLTSANFTPRVNLTPGSGPTATVMADFDGDGKPDLAVSDGTSHTVSVFRNISTNGTLTAGSFGPRVVLSATGTTGNTPYMLVAADVDGDGKLDLITTDMGVNSVSVFRSVATPGTLTASSFAARVAFTVGTSPRDVVVRDLDGDGKPEIVTANGGSATVSVLKNISSPGVITSNSFVARVDFAVGSGAHGLAVADLDGDGKPDIATANGSTTTISLLRNISSLGVLATNSFAAAATLPAPSYPHFLRAADLDGDGKLDLILTSYLGQSVSVYRSLAVAGTLNASSFAPRVEFALGTRGHTISIGDLNGDAKPDVVVDCEIPDRICLFQNLSTAGSFTSGSFAARVDLPAGYNAWGSSVGDLDGDARPDIAYANYYEGTISFAQNLSGAPRFLQQPISQTVYVGDSVTLAASATGSQPLTYHWYRNNDPISGAGLNSFTISNADLGQAGTYSVAVSNAFGAVISSNAVLTVLVPECTTPPVGLVGWWSGNGNAFDSVSTNHGTWNGAAQYSAAKVDSGMFLDGTSYLDVGNSSSLNVGLGDGMSIEGWINPASIADQQPLAEWASDGIEVGVHFWISVPYFGTPRPGCLYANLMDDTHNAHTFASASGLIQAGELQHVALTYDKASGMARMYRNGQEVGSANLGTFTPNTASDLLLGKRASPPGINYTGVLDEVGLYNRSLSSNEIVAIYNARSEGKCKLRPTVLAVTPPGAFVNEGQTVSFTALAVGSPALSCQWQYNFTDILGATSATITLSNVVYAQAGNYCVIVSNSAGISDKWNVVLRVNRAPIADASATASMVVSLNGSNAVVTLDGSRSSDPDGDALTYGWFNTGGSNAFTTGVTAVATLPLGTDQMTLVVNDGMASNSQNLTVKVISTAAAFDDLRTLVRSGHLGPRANPLLAGLRVAENALNHPHDRQVIARLRAFQFWVRILVQPANPALAAQLIQEAQAIIVALDSTTNSAPNLVKIESIRPGVNGHPHLSISGQSGGVYIVEVSTDMANWVPLGEATESSPSVFEFDDDSTQSGSRFYRVVAPE